MKTLVEWNNYVSSRRKAYKYHIGILKGCKTKEDFESLKNDFLDEFFEDIEFENNQEVPPSGPIINMLHELNSLRNSTLSIYKDIKILNNF